MQQYYHVNSLRRFTSTDNHSDRLFYEIESIKLFSFLVYKSVRIFQFTRSKFGQDAVRLTYL